jgi:hypothetical protein
MRWQPGLSEVLAAARHARLAEPEDEHERGAGGQLDVDVVGRPHTRQKPTAINHSADNRLLEIEDVMGSSP